MTDDITDHFVLIIPAGLMFLHNMIAYLLIYIRIVRSSCLVIVYKYIRVRFTATVCVFLLTLVTAMSVYVWFVTGNYSFHLVFVISTIANMMIILGLSLRLFFMSRKSDKYTINMINEESSHTDKNMQGGLKEGVYFSPEAGDLKMTDIRLAQETAMLCNKKEHETLPAISEENDEKITNGSDGSKAKVDGNDNVNVSSFLTT